MNGVKFDKTTAAYNKATTLLSKKKYDKAESILKQCLKEYECKEILVNLGNCVRARGDDAGAMALYTRAIQTEVPTADPVTILHALNNLGLSYYTIGDDYRAMQYYTKAIKLNPEFWDAWWNASTCKLRIASNGDLTKFPEAWEMYNSRFLRTNPIILQNTKASLNYWVPGEPCDDLFILVEQGIGDSLMFGRYLPLLKKYAKNVHVQCSPVLYDIFADYNPTNDACNTPAEVAYPICSLGHVFNTEIPAGNWLVGSTFERSLIAHEFPSNTFNVGIVWAGSPSHTNDRYRSIPINRFHRLANHCSLYSLSPFFNGNKYVRKLPISSWTDTANYIKGLDLVIGVDTSVMHMVGSLGCEGWLLQPMKETDFRWGNGVSKSIWYSDIRIFENPNSWDVVFDNVEKALIDEISRRKMG